MVLLSLLLYAWLVRHSLGEFLLKLHAQGLGHEAVIEIMVALLGVMMAVMAIIAVLVTLFFAILGFFGYKAIEERSVMAAEKKAAEVAEAKVQAAIEEYRYKQQAIEIGASQPSAPPARKQGTSGAKSNTSKKTSDSSLVSRKQK